MDPHHPPSLPALGAGAASCIAGSLEHWEGESVGHWARAWSVPELHILARTSSTNDAARRLADRGAPSGTTVLTDEQTAGKGRRGRSWHAPPGRALLLSTVLRPLPPNTLRSPTAIPICVGLAVARAIEAVAPVTAALKWPNDVLIAQSGKVAGILCEGALSHGAADYVVAGIGINVNQNAAELPRDADARATSLAIAAGRDTPRAELAAAVIAELDRVIRCAGEPLDAALVDEYSRRDVLRGEQIIVDDTIRGTADGITKEGGLRIDTAAGTRTLLSGTVRLAAEHKPQYPAGPGAW